MVPLRKKVLKYGTPKPSIGTCKALPRHISAQQSFIGVQKAESSGGAHACHSVVLRFERHIAQVYRHCLLGPNKHC